MSASKNSVAPRWNSGRRYVDSCSAAYTNPQTDIQILRVVCCYYATVIPPTHDGMSLEIVMTLRDCWMGTAP